MKKIIFTLGLVFCLFSTEGLAQQKPSKKELLKLWNSLNAEQQTQFLQQSQRWIDAKKNAPKAVEAVRPTPPVVVSNTPPPPPPRKGDMPPPPPNAGGTPPPPKDERQANPPSIAVRPAPPAVKPADAPLVLAPSNQPNNMMGTPPAPPVDDSRPEYLKKVESMAKTSVKWDSELFDFGKIKQGDVAKHTFKFKNTGSAPLLISFVKPSCGCTTPNWTKEEIAPGGEGTVEIHFNSAGKSGTQQKSITVFANTEPVIMNLQFKGEIFVDPTPGAPAIQVQPQDHQNHDGHNH